MARIPGKDIVDTTLTSSAGSEDGAGPVDDGGGGDSGGGTNTVIVQDDTTSSSADQTDASATTGKPFTLPSDATYYLVGDEYIVVFTVSLPDSQVPPMTVTYVIDPEDKDRYVFTEASNGGKLTSAQFDAKYENVIEGGDALELTGLEEDTYKEWFDETFKFLIGYNPVVREDPEIARLFVEAVAGDWSESQIQTRLEQTQYWLDTNQTARTWDQSSPADQQRLTHTQLGNLSQAFRQYNSRMPNAEEQKMLLQMSTEVASGVMSYGQAANSLFDTAAEDDDTPAAAQMREYNRHDTDIENKIGDLRNQAVSWGVTVSDKELAAWGQKVIDLDDSQEDYDSYLKDLAESQWGSREAGTSNRARDVAVSSWAGGYTSVYQEMMEVNGDQASMLFDSGFQDSFDPKTTLGEFRKTLRRTDKWKETENGRGELSDRMAGIGRMMGFN